MKNEKIEKGCVYFFKHIGLTPVKIGYSANESPLERFYQFKTYAPYGSEIIGFIITPDAKQLESTLHEKFSQNRLCGEWFEIKKEECENVILYYSNIEDIKEKNDFQIEWAKKVNNRNRNYNKVIDIEQISVKGKIKPEVLTSSINSFIFKNKHLSKTECAERLGISRKTLYKHISRYKKYTNVIG